MVYIERVAKDLAEWLLANNPSNYEKEMNKYWEIVAKT
jgi:hypothetical protein